MGETVAGDAKSFMRRGILNISPQIGVITLLRDVARGL
jgi:hypothetical protein